MITDLKSIGLFFTFNGSETVYITTLMESNLLIATCVSRS